MGARETTRLLVRVSPRVFQDALVRVLRDLGLDEVHTVATAPRRVDAAIVCGPVPVGVSARVVITLDASGRPARPVRVVVDGRAVPCVLGGVEGIVALLDEHCKAERSRSEALDPAGRPRGA